MDCTRCGEPRNRGGYQPVVWVLVLLSLLTMAPAAGALAATSRGDDSRVISDRWILEAGTYLPNFSTDASVGTGAVIGTLVRAEDELGLEDRGTLFRTVGAYRFNSRHAIGVGYWAFGRNGERKIDEKIEFDGNLYDIGAKLTSSFDTQYIRADWRYSFLRTQRGETGINLGLSTYSLKVELRGVASVDDGMGGTILEAAAAEKKVFAPVPTFGMFVNYAVRPTIIFRASFNFLDLDTGDLEGNLTESAFLFEWYPSRHVGVGGGISATKIEVKNGGKDPYDFTYDLSGFLAYVSFAFGRVD